LRLAGYTVETTARSAGVASLLRGGRLDAVIVDPLLEPNSDVIAELRSQTDVPIIVVSRRDDERVKVDVLNAGADDYLTKPFGFEELVARLGAVLRRVAREEDERPVSTADFTIHVADRLLVRSDGTEVRLTPTEWRLVEVLVRRPGHLVGQRELLGAVWGPRALDKTDYIRVYLAAIRRKLEPERGRPRYFLTAPGLGLRFDPTGGEH
jgi:two-component system, OmpR family, KDP operon response regulator KdpE